MAKHVCPWWLAYTFDNPLRGLFHEPERILKPYLREGMTAADIGCGMGYFSIAMAKIVGAGGKIIAVDLQAKMLEILVKRAHRAGVANRISTILCDENSIGLTAEVDFVLAFWMVHETSAEGDFLRQAQAILARSGKLLLVEPKGHVTRNAFQKTVSLAQGLGFRLIASPKIAFSHTALFEKHDAHH